MKEQIEGIMEWALRCEQEYTAQGQALLADGRGDEANLMRIRGNICGVFRALLKAAQNNAARQASGSNTPATLPELAEKTTEPWKQQQHKAQEHGDAITVTIEQAKLETMAMLMDEWVRREGGVRL